MNARGNSLRWLVMNDWLHTRFLFEGIRWNDMHSDQLHIVVGIHVTSSQCWDVGMVNDLSTPWSFTHAVSAKPMYVESTIHTIS